MSKMLTSLIGRMRAKEAPEELEARERAQQNLVFRASQVLARTAAPRPAA